MSDLQYVYLRGFWYDVDVTDSDGRNSRRVNVTRGIAYVVEDDPIKAVTDDHVRHQFIVEATIDLTQWAKNVMNHWGRNPTDVIAWFPSAKPERVTIGMKPAEDEELKGWVKI